VMQGARGGQRYGRRGSGAGATGIGAATGRRRESAQEEQAEGSSRSRAGAVNRRRSDDRYRVRGVTAEGSGSAELDEHLLDLQLLQRHPRLSRSPLRGERRSCTRGSHRRRPTSSSAEAEDVRDGPGSAPRAAPSRESPTGPMSMAPPSTTTFAPESQTSRHVSASCPFRPSDWTANAVGLRTELHG
jgi:hypothetical protein